MTLGAEPKKIAFLAVLVVIAIGGYFLNQTDSPPQVSSRPVAPVAAVPGVPARSGAPDRRRAGGRLAGGEFKPTLGPARPEDRRDPASIDPELRLDLLAKVQALEPVAAGRNLFQFGAAPAPPKPIPAVPTNVQKIPVNQPPPMQAPPSMATNTPPAPTPPPPINMKYYGYKIRKSDGQKEAFLMDGDEIILAKENQTLKQRYRIVRIALTSITIEDTQFRNTQTLTLQDLPA